MMLWTDFYGSYGDPSYTYYLFDPIHQAVVESPELAKATHGFTLSRIRGNQLDLWYRDGPCLRGEKVLEIRGTTPVEISRNDYSTCDLQHHFPSEDPPVQRKGLQMSDGYGKHTTGFGITREQSIDLIVPTCLDRSEEQTS